MIRVAEDEAAVTPIGQSGELISLLRQNFHGEHEADTEPDPSETSDHAPARRDSSKLIELVLCSKDERAADDDGILIGEWDPHSDEISSSIRIPKADLEALFGSDGALTREKLEQNRSVLQRIYRKMRLTSDVPPVRLDSLRRRREYLAFILGERVKGEGDT